MKFYYWFYEIFLKLIRLSKEKGTLFIVNILGYKFLRKINYRYQEISEEVYICSDVGKAWTTPLNTIVMDEKLFEKYSKNVRDYSFLHEIGHIKTNLVVTAVFYLASFIALFGFFGSLIYFIIIPIIFFVSDLSPIFIFSLPFVVIFFTFLHIIVFWPYEGYAELFSLKRLGKSKYKKCKKEIKKKSGKRFFLMDFYFSKLMYPPEKVIFWFYEKF